jgi:hypothetical protein
MTLPEVFNFVETAGTLTRGTNFFEGYLPEGDREGVALRTARKVDVQNQLESDIIIVDVVYKSYIYADTLSDTIFNALKTQRGLGPVWTIVGTITKDHLGIDDLRRNVFEIRFSITHY